MLVLCVGQIVADVVVRPIGSLPPKGQVQRVEHLDFVSGGCAANVACVLAKLGVEASVIGAVGRDPLGDFCVSEISACGADVSRVVRSATAPTSAVVVVVDDLGERSFLYRDGGNEILTTDMIPDAALQEADFVHVGGALKLRRLDIAGLLARARGLGCVTSLDTDWSSDGHWLDALESAMRHIDYLLTNEDEGRMLTGCSDLRQIGKQLIARGAGNVVIKRGSRGAAVFTGSEVMELPAFHVPVVDTTCAGDSFAAGFLFALAQRQGIEDTVRFASATGALSTTQVSHRGVTSFPAVMEILRSQSDVVVRSDSSNCEVVVAGRKVM